MKHQVNSHSQRLVSIVAMLCLVALIGTTQAEPANDKRPVQVFILAGQSNMEGQGVVDLDHPRYYNGGRGTLNWHMRDPKKAERYKHVKDADGNWVVRNDVWVRYRTPRGLKRGPLSIGYAVYGGKHHIGPEFQFGHLMGQHLDEQVLLIKTAWGGKSLHKDFRPPSAVADRGGEVGPYYKKMLAEVREALDALPNEFDYDKRGYEIVGFVWFQGWNDMFNDDARADYEQNLVHLIDDVRKAWGKPKLPVVIGELGNGGEKAGKNMIAIRKAQAAAAVRPRFKGTVKFVKTTAFARPAKDSPNTGHGHHWFGNAESYFLIGDAMGHAMLDLLGKSKR